MSSGTMTNVNGAWSEEENAWVSEDCYLTGDCWLEVVLPGKGRMLMRKAETQEGPWPRCLSSNWSGPEFRIRIYGSTEYRYVRIYLSSTPSRIQFYHPRVQETSPE